jgi:hypothetical protein
MIETATGKEKQLIREVIENILIDNKRLLYDIVQEIIEDMCMGEAIKKGRKGVYVSEKRIMEALER